MHPNGKGAEVISAPTHRKIRFVEEATFAFRVRDTTYRSATHDHRELLRKGLTGVVSKAEARLNRRTVPDRFWDRFTGSASTEEPGNGAPAFQVKALIEHR